MLKPTYEPKVTDNINEIINFIQHLIQKGFAYESQGHVFFAVKKFHNYGSLSNRKPGEDSCDSFKREKIDFVLWKPCKKVFWTSPWGLGRPGWHIECSTLSEIFLGKSFDIHCGGKDLLFPHHENEIAQSCAKNNTQKLADFWLHSGMVKINGGKMSKSAGNIIKVKELIKHYSPEEIRFACFFTHYRQDMSWNDSLLRQSTKMLLKIKNFIGDCKSECQIQDIKVMESIQNDLNTPMALSRIYKMMGEKSNENRLKVLNFMHLIGIF